MRLGKIRQFGDDPGAAQDGKFAKYSSVTDKVTFEEIIPGENNVQSDWNEANINSDAYIKNKPTIPDSLDDLSGDSDDITEGTTNLFLTSTERIKLSNIAENAEVNVQSDWNQSVNTEDDYIKNKPSIPNSLDDLSGTLDNIADGTANVHLTTTLRTNLNLNTAARHSHTNKNILDAIVDAGSGSIITAAERQAIVDMVSGNPEVIRDTVAAFIQDTPVVTWTHDDENDTLTPEIVLTSFTTDDLSEGTTNLYGNNATLKPVQAITLPAYASVALRASNAVAGTDYPTGWVLSAGTSEYDLLITHGLGRKVTDVSVFEILPNTSTFFGTPTFIPFFISSNFIQCIFCVPTSLVNNG